MKIKDKVDRKRTRKKKVAGCLRSSGQYRALQYGGIWSKLWTEESCESSCHLGKKVFPVVKVAQSCPTLCDPMDYRVYGILQARILEWVAFPFLRGSSQPRDQTQVSCIAGGLFTKWATSKCEVSESKAYPNKIRGKKKKLVKYRDNSGPGHMKIFFSK